MSDNEVPYIKIRDQGRITNMPGECIGCERLRVELEAIRPVFTEAQRLVHSGYDGPFMGDAVSDLIKAVLEAEKIGG